MISIEIIVKKFWIKKEISRWIAEIVGVLSPIPESSRAGRQAWTGRRGDEYRRQAWTELSSKEQRGRGLRHGRGDGHGPRWRWRGPAGRWPGCRRVGSDFPQAARGKRTQTRRRGSQAGRSPACPCDLVHLSPVSYPAKYPGATRGTGGVDLEYCY